ncbi:MAG: hypothetical protein IJ130_14000 [Solobacterium sp.]|nr:hypothetical protein [Solobacterium sp.]
MVTRTPAEISAALWAEITHDLDPGSSTVNDYRKVLNLLHSSGNGKYRILTMTTEDAAEYFSSLDQRVRNGDLSPNTAHRYKATLRSLGRRIEECRSVEGFESPFSGLIKNEKRLRTSYNENMFVTPDTVRKIRSVLTDIPKRDRIMIELILYLGLTPNQIRQIRVCDFRKQKDGRMTLEVNEGPFLETTKKKPEESDLYLSGAPVRYLRSSTRGITWEYTGTFIFSDALSAIVSMNNATLGLNDDTRPFFMTSRHREYSYRALHHLINEICRLSGIEETITPYQLALTGIVNSWLLQQKNTADNRWAEFPIPLLNMISTMQEQLPEGFLESLRYEDIPAD